MTSRFLVPSVDLRSKLYLFRDDFLTSEAAPITSPRTCEPGPGTWPYIQDTGNYLPISGGELVSNGTVDGFDPMIISEAIDRVTGHAWKAHFRHTDASNFKRLQVGIFNSTSFTNIGSGSFFFRHVGDYWRALTFTYLGTWSKLDEFKAAYVIQDSTELLYLNNITAGTGWKLEWIETASGWDPYYFAINPVDGYWNVDYVRMAPLGTPFNTNNAYQTDLKSGSVAQATTFSHEADTVLVFTVTTMPTVNPIVVAFRQEDANNYWAVYIRPAGDLQLYEFTSGAGVQRATTAAAVANGYRIVITVDDETIQGYSGTSNPNRQWAYASATQYKTETSGTIIALDTGAVSDLYTAPRYPSGQALEQLEAI